MILCMANGPLLVWQRICATGKILNVPLDEKQTTIPLLCVFRLQYEDRYKSTDVSIIGALGVRALWKVWIRGHFCALAYYAISISAYQYFSIRFSDL